MGKTYNYRLVLENDRPNSFSTSCFQVTLTCGQEAFIVIYDDGGPKTPHAVANWAASSGMNPPLWCKWVEPKVVGSINHPSSKDEWTDELEGRTTWIGKEERLRRSLEGRWYAPAKAYARTFATVQFSGEPLPRRLRVTFTWAFQLSGEGRINLPRTNGGNWVVEDVGLPV